MSTGTGSPSQITRSMPMIPVGQADRGVAGEDLGETAIEDQRADGDDDRRQLQPDDEQGVEEPEQEAGAEADEDRQRHRQARLQHPGEEAGRQRHGRGGREVDLAGDDHHGEHQRDQRQLGESG